MHSGDCSIFVVMQVEPQLREFATVDDAIRVYFSFGYKYDSMLTMLSMYHGENLIVIAIKFLSYNDRNQLIITIGIC